MLNKQTLQDLKSSFVSTKGNEVPARILVKVILSDSEEEVKNIIEMLNKPTQFSSFDEARNFIEENLGDNFSAYRHLDKKEYYVIEEVDSANAKFISHNKPTELKVVGKIELKQPKECMTSHTKHIKQRN